jgi:hypothetical protein
MDTSKHRSCCARYSDPIANVVGAHRSGQGKARNRLLAAECRQAAESVEEIDRPPAMSDQYPMDRNGGMEQSESVGPLTQIATPAHLGPIMSPLHSRNATEPQSERGACSGHDAAGSGHGAAELIRAGCPLGASAEPREARAVRWPVRWVLAMPLLAACAGCMPRTDVMRALLEQPEGVDDELVAEEQERPVDLQSAPSISDSSCPIKRALVSQSAGRRCGFLGRPPWISRVSLAPASRLRGSARA